MDELHVNEFPISFSRVNFSRFAPSVSLQCSNKRFGWCKGLEQVDIHEKAEEFHDAGIAPITPAPTAVPSGEASVGDAEGAEGAEGPVDDGCGNF